VFFTNLNFYIKVKIGKSVKYRWSFFGSLIVSNHLFARTSSKHIVRSKSVFVKEVVA